MILDTDPTDPRTRGYRTFFPIMKPIHVKKGDAVYLVISTKITADAIKWKWKVKDNNLKFDHDTDRSCPTTYITEVITEVSGEIRNE